MKQIAKALVTAQKNFAPAIKSSKNPHFKNSYAPLDVCLEAVMDAFNEAGIFLMQAMHESEGGVVIETTFVHESGEVMSAGKLFVPASKNDAQGFGSALTYARRYSLMSACGISGENDDDGEGARKVKEESERKAKEDAINKQNAEDAELLSQYEEEAAKGMAFLQSFHGMCKGDSKARVWHKHGERLKKIASAVKIAEVA